MDPKSYGARTDGTPKGLGYFGELPRTDDPRYISTELSVTSEVDGKPLLHPLLVPTLTREEIDYLLGAPQKKAPLEQTIRQKALAHAMDRIKAGKSPFAGDGEQQALPLSEQKAFQKGYGP